MSDDHNAEVEAERKAAACDAAAAAAANTYQGDDRAFPSNAINPRFDRMSLRDWFAGQFANGLASHPGRSGTSNEFAEAAYLVADAMMAERAKRMERANSGSI